MSRGPFLASPSLYLLMDASSMGWRASLEVLPAGGGTVLGCAVIFCAGASYHSPGDQACISSLWSVSLSAFQQLSSGCLSTLQQQSLHLATLLILTSKIWELSCHWGISLIPVNVLGSLNVWKDVFSKQFLVPTEWRLHMDIS